MLVYTVATSISRIRKSQRLVLLTLHTSDLDLLICCSTFLKECPFNIKIRTSGDGQELYVKEINGEHNHELSKVCVTW